MSVYAKKVTQLLENISILLETTYMSTLDNDSVLMYSTDSGWPTHLFISKDHGDLKDASHIDYYNLNKRKANEISKKLWDEKDLLQIMRAAFDSGRAARIRDSVEALTLDRTFAPIVTNHRQFNKKDLFKFVTTDLKIPLSYYEKYFGKIEGIIPEEKIGKAELFFPEGIRENNKKNLMSLMRNIYSKFKSNGVSKIFSGPIRFVKMSGKTIGLYYQTDKDIKIKYTASDDDTTEFTIIHEFGHKLYYEFLQGKHKEITDKYYEVREGGHRFDNKKIEDQLANLEKQFLDIIKIGDIISYKGRKRKFVGDWQLLKKEGSYLSFAIPGQKTSTLGGRPSSFMKDGWSSKDKRISKLMDYKEVPLTKSIGSANWFPTKYSQTDVSEWFAELFAFYILNKLKGEPEEFIENIIE